MNENDVIDLLVEWGKVHLLTPEFKNYLVDLEAEAKSNIDFDRLDDLLLNELATLRQDIASSINILSSPDLLGATEVDELWDTAIEAFSTFDKVNYLYEAVHYLIPKYHQVLEPITTDLKTKLDQSINWLYEDLSPLRLTVLNNHRLKLNNLIPEGKQYLFPWYSLCANHSENTIDAVIDYWDAFTSHDISSIPKELSDTFGEVKSEIERDAPLHKFIEDRHRLDLAFKEAASKRTALMLWRMSERALNTYLVPSEIIEKGLVRTSTQFISNIIHSNVKPGEIIEIAFLSAFSGPGLKDTERLRILEFVEHEMNKSDSFVTHLNILPKLKSWFEGKLDNVSLTEDAFRTWFHELNSAAAALSRVQKDTDISEFCKVLDKVMKTDVAPGMTKADGPQPLWEQIKRALWPFQRTDGDNAWGWKEILSFGVPAAAAAAILMIVVGRFLMPPVPSGQIAANLPKTEKSPVLPLSPETTAPSKETASKGEYTPPAGRTLVAQLAKKTDIRSLKPAVTNEEAFSFSSATDRETIALRTGVLLTDLQVSAMNADRTAIVGILNKLARIFAGEKAGTKEASSLNERSGDIERGGTIGNLDYIFTEAERIFGNSRTRPYLQFGEWAEAGRLATEAGTYDLTDNLAVRYFVHTIDYSRLPQSASKTLSEIESILGKTAMNEEDRRRLKGDFRTIVEVLF